MDVDLGNRDRHLGTYEPEFDVPATAGDPATVDEPATVDDPETVVDLVIGHAGAQDAVAIRANEIDVRPGDAVERMPRS